MHRNITTGVAATLLLALSAAGCSRDNEQRVDVLIRDGLIYDGAGGEPYEGSVGIVGDRILFVGEAPRRLAAGRVINARGLAVSPGFIDVHSHVPEAIERIEGPFIDAQDLSQGVTTIVEGPDGGLSPNILRMLNGALGEHGFGVNYACYVGHNGIRSEVMPGLTRAATAEEIAQMATLVREGMEMGCVGFSTGLMYDPGMYATSEEVETLAREVRPFNGSYDSHTRDPAFQMVASEREAIDLGRHVGIPVKLAHLKAVGLINRGRIGEVADMVEEARAEGHEVVADQYPFDGATVRMLHDLFVLPDGRGDHDVSPEEVRSALSDPAHREAVRAATENGVEGGFSWVKAVGYGSMRIVSAPADPSLVDENIELLAQRRGVAPFDLLADLLLSQEHVKVTLGSIDETDIRTLIVKPWVMIASDGAYVDAQALAAGNAHPRSSGSFTRVLGHYSRELGLFPMEEAIRKMTSFPADHLGLGDRGRLAPGKAADVVVFDPKTIAARANYDDPAAFSAGVDIVFVNGRSAFENGAPTGVVAGQFVRRQAPAAQ